MMAQFIKHTYSIAQSDDVKLTALAQHSGTGNKSAELRTLIRREYDRVFGTTPVLDLRPEKKRDDQ